LNEKLLKHSKKQIYSLKKISKKIIRKYNIIDSNVVGHSDIAPLRKKDPGEKFPWKELANSKIGIWHRLKTKQLKKNRRKKINLNEKKSEMIALRNQTAIGLLLLVILGLLVF